MPSICQAYMPSICQVNVCQIVIIWVLATPISSVGPSMSNITFDIEDFDIVCSFDIDVLHLRYRISISKAFDIEGLIIRYRTSITGLPILWFTDFLVWCLRYWTNELRYRMLISYTISKVTLTFEIGGHVIHICFDIGHYIVALSQCNSLRSGSSLWPGTITPTPKSLSVTCPGFLHPLLRNSTAWSTKIWKGMVLP